MHVLSLTHQLLRERKEKEQNFQYKGYGKSHCPRTFKIVIYQIKKNGLSTKTRNINPNTLDKIGHHNLKNY